MKLHYQHNEFILVVSTFLSWSIIALCFSIKPIFVLQLMWTIFPEGIMTSFPYTFTSVSLSYTLLCWISSTNVSILSLPTSSNTIWNRLTIHSVSFLFCIRCFVALNPRMVSFNFCFVTRNGTFTSAIFMPLSIFTDISTHPTKGMFSSSPHCTLSESQLSRIELMSCMGSSEKFDLSVISYGNLCSSI